MDENKKCTPTEMMSCPVETGYEAMSLSDRLHLAFRNVFYHMQHSDDLWGDRKASCPSLPAGAA